jgi:hypothetical protein
VVNSAPSTPGIPSPPSEIKGGNSITVSWSAASDTDGNLSGYELYVSLDGGSWTQVYKGSSRSYNYTVPEGTETIAFRVRAYDSMSAYSSYATSATSAVTNVTIVDYGYVNIDGVNRNFTGEGYATIDGVSRPLVKYFGCVDSIWRSLTTGTKVANLPSGYTQLEYIESSGTQYIDTGFIANQDTRVVLDYKATSATSGGTGVFGCRTNSASNAFVLFIMPSGAYWNYGTQSQLNTFTTTSVRTIVDCNQNTAVLTSGNGESTTITLASSTFTTPRALILASAYDSKSGIYSGNAGYHGYIYSC